MISIELLTLLIVLVYDVLDLRGWTRVSRPEPLPTSPVPDPPPRVSVIVPVFEDTSGLESTLRSIRASQYPNYELLLVDDGSATPAAVTEIDACAAQVDRLFRLEHGGKHHAVNHAVAESQGDVIVIVDADTEVEDDCVETLVGLLSDPQRAAAIDVIPTVSNLQSGLWPRFAAFEREMLAVRPTSFGALFAIRRDAWPAEGMRASRSPQYDLDRRLAAQSQLAFSRVPEAASAEPETLVATYRRKRRWVMGMLEASGMLGKSPGLAVYVSVLSTLVLAQLPLAMVGVGYAPFTLVLLVAWAVKARLVANELELTGQPVTLYPLYMATLSIAATEALLRHLFRSEVPWR